MAESTVIRAEKDFTKEVDQLLPEAEKLSYVISSFRCDYLLLTPIRITSRELSKSFYFSRNKPDRYFRAFCIRNKHLRL
jgi:hypothetical protein